MKKRIMAMLMAAMMLIAALPFTAFAEEAAVEVSEAEAFEAAALEVVEVEEKQGSESGAAAENETAEAGVAEAVLGDSQETDWDLLKGAMAGAVNTMSGLFEVTVSGTERTVKLLTDFTDENNEGALEVPTEKTVILDLNGCTIDRNLTEAKDNGNVIVVKNKSSFTLKDSGTGGKITGGNSTGNGGGIYISAKASFTMESGEISGNEAKSGGGVHLDNDTYFFMNGGIITGNICHDNYGGGVNFLYSRAGRMILGGNAVVKENVNEDNGVETTNNVHTVNQFKFETGADAPKEGMLIGFSYEHRPRKGNEVQLTDNGSSGYEEYLISDDPKCKVAYNSTAQCLYLQAPSLSLSADKEVYEVGETITLTATAKFLANKLVTVTESNGIQYTVLLNGDGVATISERISTMEPGVYSYVAEIAEYKLQSNSVSAIVNPRQGYTVTFDTRGGSDVPSQTVKEGEKAVKPQAPTKADCNFAGWYKNTDYTVVYDFSAPVTKDITLYARWVVKPEPSSDGDSRPLFTGTWGNAVTGGKWSQDSNGVWHYASSQQFCGTWGYIENPFAKAGQNKADWFWFDSKGNMLTGWQLINGKWYYLNPSADGTLGACLIGPGKTPDGWEIDATGAWTGK